MSDSVAQFLHRRRRLVLVLALIVAALAGVFSAGVNNRLSNSASIYEDAAAPSVAARHLIEKATGVDASQGYVVLVRTDRALSPGDPAPAAVAAADRDLRARPETVSVTDYTTAGPSLISDDGRWTAVVAALRPMTEKGAQQGTDDLQKTLRDDPALHGRALLGGATPARYQVGEVSFSDLGRAELMALPIIFLVLFLVFRGLVAAALPVIGAVFTLMLTFGGLEVAIGFMTVASGALNLATALGLGLSIDFSLLTVSRFREELARGRTTEAAVRVCLATASRTVVFSALTIAAALSALLVFPQPYLRSMGLAGILTTAAAALFAVLVLPSVLAALGGRVDALSVRRRRGEGDASVRHWRRRTQRIVRRPALFGAGALVVMVALAAPALGVRFTGIDGTSLPDGVSSGRVAAVLDASFTRPPAEPLQVLVTAGPAKAGAVAAYRGRLAAAPGIAAVGRPRMIDARHWQMDVIPKGPPLSSAAQRAVRSLERRPAQFPVAFTGGTADFLDSQHSLGGRLPWALLVLCVTTFLLLFAFTGSVVLPLTSLVMNVLSTGAAIGVLVVVFQGTAFQGLLGFTSQGALESTDPILLAALAFGLSTDYAVFLLGRIKEARASGTDDRTAVVDGLSHTGRIVTSAAILFCVPVGALMLSRVMLIKELGLGTAFAVLVDATVVRTVLVPAIMSLLGPRAWWSPRPLRTLHARLGLAGLRESDDGPTPDPMPDAVAERV